MISSVALVRHLSTVCRDHVEEAKSNIASVPTRFRGKLEEKKTVQIAKVFRMIHITPRLFFHVTVFPDRSNVYKLTVLPASEMDTRDLVLYVEEPSGIAKLRNCENAIVHNFIRMTRLLRNYIHKRSAGPMSVPKLLL